MLIPYFSVLPMQQADKFKTLGIKPPKGALMYGPPGKASLPRVSSSFSAHPSSSSGTGKTLLARVCAAQVCAVDAVSHTSPN